MKSFESLTEREILALAISLEEEDARIFQEFARRLRSSYPKAADDLEGIANYLYLHHPSFAASTIQRLYASAKSLKQFPFAGRVGKT